LPEHVRDELDHNITAGSRGIKFTIQNNIVGTILLKICSYQCPYIGVKSGTPTDPCGGPVPHLDAA
jgi:hypothetical protein